MAYRNIDDSRAAIRKHYYKNKATYLAKNKRRREEMRSFVRKLKENAKCTDCNKSYPYFVMDFDHIEDKKFLISKLVNAGNRTRLEKEIEKCEIVCSNCHRIRTYSRIQNSV